MPRLKYPSPVVLRGALELSDDDDLDAEEIDRLLFDLPEVRDCSEAVKELLSKKYGPERAGDILRVMLHKVASRQQHLERHWTHAPGSVWRLADFPNRPARQMRKRRRRKPCRPSKALYYERSKELARPACVDRIYVAVAELIAKIREHHPMFMQYLMGDGTGVQAHVTFRHCCDEESCPRKGKRRSLRPDTVVTRLSSDRDDDYEEEGAEEELAVDEPLKDLIGRIYEFNGEVLEVRRSPDERRAMQVRVIRKKKGKEEPSCWYETRCAEAWIRIYTRKDGSVKRMWIGYIQQAITDIMTGVQLCGPTYSARRNESSTLPETWKLASRILFGDEDAVVDEGFALAYDKAAYDKTLFEFFTCRGIALVTPERADPHAPPEGRNELRWDCDGVGRCDLCGAPGTPRRFRIENGRPRVAFSCKACALRAGNEHEFSLACSNDWRRLVPLNRLNPVHHELLVARGNREGAHADKRQRWGTGGNDVGSRMRRIGTDWQNLHGALVSLIEVALAGYRLGVFGEAKRAKTVASDYKKVGKEKREAMLDRRRAHNLHLPYGPQAAQFHPDAPAHPPGKPPDPD